MYEQQRISYAITNLRSYNNKILYEKLDNSSLYEMNKKNTFLAINWYESGKFYYSCLKLAAGKVPLKVRRNRDCYDIQQ